MKLWQLLAGVPLTGECSNQDMEITSISYDTRTLLPGALFVALPGAKTDGSLYIDQALAKGAAAVVCRRRPQREGVFFTTPDPRRALALLAENWFGHPGREMTLIGVTGTNGKTTTTFLIKEMLEGVLKTRVGLIGTIQNMVGERVLPAHRTTPESYEVQQLLREMADSGCTHVVMEVSSHALVQHRVEGLDFSVAAFTNLTQDHLDYHHTMEEYRDAKGLLFRQCETAVLNLDDEAGRYLARTVAVPRLTYSERRDEADLTAKNLRLFPDRVEFEAVAEGAISRVRLPIPGGFTVYNALGVLTCGLALGLPLADCADALAKAPGVKGRIEVVPVPADFAVIIDYAHTPDALENILTTVRDFTAGRVICLFGCGGDRDRTKRPQMGAIAGSLADVAVVTSDNPRTEEPEAIIRDILPGLEGTAAQVVVEPDRRAAIRRALSLAKPGDTVVLAGKGHETYQEVGTQVLHLDEREEVAAYFAS